MALAGITAGAFLGLIILLSCWALTEVARTALTLRRKN